jgi:hypothetical protein
MSNPHAGKKKGTVSSPPDSRKTGRVPYGETNAGKIHSYEWILDYFV